MWYDISISDLREGEYISRSNERNDRMQPEKLRKRLKLQQNIITAASLAMIIFILVWLIHVAGTGRENGLKFIKIKRASESSSVSDSSSASDSKKDSKDKSSSSSAAASDSAASSEAGSQELAKPADYEGAAQNDDFSDACFIGDSRTVGLSLNGDKPGADFFASQGLNISTALTDPVVTNADGTTSTVIEALWNKKYRRIFVSFGLNELGWPYYDNFISQYCDLVEQIKSVQNDADIYIQSILPVASFVSSEQDKEIFTNEKIDEFNTYISQVAERTGTNYLEVNSYFKTSAGALPDDAATDGIHFVKSYCLKWIDLLAYLVPQPEDYVPDDTADAYADNYGYAPEENYDYTTEDNYGYTTDEQTYY